MVILPTKPSKKNKKKNKASAQSKGIKDTTAQPDSETIETTDTTKGVSLEEVDSVIATDVEKVITKEFESLTDLFDSDDPDEEFNIKTKGRTTVKRIANPKVEAMPESAVLEVLRIVWEKNREQLLSHGFSKKNASKLAGCKTAEFRDYLDLVIPDDYTPKGKHKKNLKSEKPNSWKFDAVNNPAINRKMKELMAKGLVIIYKVDGRNHHVPTESVISPEIYNGSKWHINQIRNILYRSAQWKGSETPYINFFSEGNPLDLSLKEFDKALGLDKDLLNSFWTKSGFDTTKLKEVLGTQS